MERGYEEVIEPRRAWWDADWAGLWRYRDLLFLLVRRDWVMRYRQTLLGPAWIILQPLLTTGIFAVIFANLLKIPTHGLPPVLFYLSGFLIWNFFARSVAAIAGTFTDHAALFGKVYFPRLIIPLTVLLSNLIALTIQGMIFIGLACAWLHPGVFALALPLVVLEAALLALGMGLWIAALTVRYYDLKNLVAPLLNLWMLATPVIYPASLVSERWQRLFFLNPMAPVIECARYALFGTGTVIWQFLAATTVAVLAVLVTGILIFNRVERTFVDIV